MAIVGAARSGTTYLAAQLGAHPCIDPGAVKEPNYYSREFERGRSWYDGLYAPSTPGVYRLDASTSLTFPQFPEALGRLADDSPDVFVIYVVRDPLPRAVSHYLYLRNYFHIEVAPTFGAAIGANPIYVGTSNYADWLPRILAHFPPERLLVVPFELVTLAQPVVAHATFGILGLDIPDVSADALVPAMEEHLWFIEALKARDPQRVASRLTHHIESSHRRVLGLPRPPLPQDDSA